MGKKMLFLFVTFFLYPFLLPAQLYLTIKPMPQEHTWGVYVRPCDTVDITDNTITGTGQVTIVTSMGSLISDIEHYGGTWSMDTKVLGPLENPSKWYYSFGLQTDYPVIEYVREKETLLFIFKLTNQDGSPPALIDNEADPFAKQPNSVGTNPGNELSVVDFGKSPLAFYNYSGNYVQDTFQCVQSNGPTATSAVFNAQMRLLLSPNPTGNWITIRIDQMGRQSFEGVLELRTIDMQVLVRKAWQGQREEVLDLGYLPKGTYWVVFKTIEGNVAMEEFLKL